MSGDRRTVWVRIEGRVQGVGFRAFIERAAGARGLDGHVRNRRDGGVEAVLQGTGASIEEVVAQCRRGPRGARVDRLDVREENASVASGFRVLATL